MRWFHALTWAVRRFVGWVWAWALTWWLRGHPHPQLYAVRYDHPAGHHTYHHPRPTWPAAQRAARRAMYSTGQWAPLTIRVAQISPGVLHAHRQLGGCADGECARGTLIADRHRR